MPVVERPKSRLFSQLDSQSSKLEKYWSSCWAQHEELLQRGAASELVELINRDPGSQQPPFCSSGDVALALLYGIITESGELQKRCIDYLMQHSRDKYMFVVDMVRKLVNSHYAQLQDSVRAPILSLTKDFLAWDAAGAEHLCLALLRCIAIGDVSEPNVWLACTLLHALRSSTEWLWRSPVWLQQAVLYKFLRVLPDVARINKKAEQALTKSSIQLCTTILTEKWVAVCSGMGRDLIRALQSVCGLQEFRAVWKDLLAGCAPGSNVAAGLDLTGTPQDVLIGILATRTPQMLLQSALTTDMEREIHFIMTQVRMGNQRRYQHWFKAQFLSSPESESVLSDLIRFICGVYHPPNQIIASDIIPRWAVIGWLMQCARSQTHLANTKMALVFDLLLFQPQVDSIMNIEPAMLLMVHSRKNHPGITNTLLEFLILSKDHFNPARRHFTTRGFMKGMSALVQKGVVNSLDVLVQSEEVSADLRSYMYNTFKQLCSAPPDGAVTDHKRPAPSEPTTPTAKKSMFANNHRGLDNMSQDLAQPSLQLQVPGNDDLGMEPEDSLETDQEPADVAEEDNVESSDDMEIRRTEMAEAGPGSAALAGPTSKAPLSPKTVPFADIRRAIAQLKDELNDVLGGDIETDELDLESHMHELIKAIGTEYRRPGEPSIDSPCIREAVAGMQECISLSQSAGIALFDILPTGSSWIMKPASISSLGGALLNAAFESPELRTSSAVYLAALCVDGSNEALASNFGPSMLLHAVSRYLASKASATKSNDRGAMQEGGGSVSGPQSNGEMSTHMRQYAALYVEYAESVSRHQGSHAHEVLVQDTLACLRWGLQNSNEILLGLFQKQTGFLELAAGNLGLAEICCAVLLPSGISRLCCSLATGASQFAVTVSSDDGHGSFCGVEFVQQSWSWDSHAQRVLWELLASELRSQAPDKAQAAVLQLLDALGGAQDGNGLGTMTAEDVSQEPVATTSSPGPESAIGIQAILSQTTPSKPVVEAVLDLPASYAHVASAAFSTWSSQAQSHLPIDERVRGMSWSGPALVSGATHHRGARVADILDIGAGPRPHGTGGHGKGGATESSSATPSAMRKQMVTEANNVDMDEGLQSDIIGQAENPPSSESDSSESD